MSSPSTGSSTERDSPESHTRTDWLPVAWQYTGDATPTPFDESIRSQMQQGFNHVELTLDVFQNAFNEHRKTIEEPLGLMEAYYHQFVRFRGETTNSLEAIRADARNDRDESRAFRNESRAEQRRAKRRVIRLREKMTSLTTDVAGISSQVGAVEARMGTVEVKLSTMETKMETIVDTMERRMGTMETRMDRMETKTDANFSKLFLLLADKL